MKRQMQTTRRLTNAYRLTGQGTSTSLGHVQVTVVLPCSTWCGAQIFMHSMYHCGAHIPVLAWTSHRWTDSPVLGVVDQRTIPAATGTALIVICGFPIPARIDTCLSPTARHIYSRISVCFYCRLVVPAPTTPGSASTLVDSSTAASTRIIPFFLEPTIPFQVRWTNFTRLRVAQSF